jgi:hypothetical protein
MTCTTPCCCNCRYKMELQTLVSSGVDQNREYYACMAPVDRDWKPVLFTGEHGECEMHERSSNP